MKPRLFKALLLLTALASLRPHPAFAFACSNPNGNEGDLEYSGLQHVLVYCNGSNWIAAGSSAPINFGTLTSPDFCTATSGTAISCTTPSTGTGSVVLSASPTLTGTVAGVSSTWTTGVAIGTTTLSGALNVNGTANATLFAGSGASLTNIPAANLSGNISVSNLNSGTGATSTTFWRGDGTWSTISVGTGSLSGTLTVPNGGTGDTALTAHGVLIGEATSPVAVSAAGASGQLLIGQGPASDPSFQTLGGDCTITNAGVITCLRTSNNLFGALATASSVNLTTQATGTLQASQEPAHTGDVTNTAGSLAMTVAKIQGTTVGGTTGSGNVAFSASPLLSGNVGIGTATLTQPLTVNGNIDAMGSYNGYITEIPNSSTATVANKLAKMFGANTVTIGTTGDTDGMIGVVVGNAGTTGAAQIAIAGQAGCVFDGTPSAVGDFVTISSTTAGDCHDSGTKIRSGISGQTIGQILNTVAISGSTYPITLNLNGAGGGGALANLSDVTLTSPANTNLLQYNGSKWVNTSLASVASAVSVGIAPSFSVQNSSTLTTSSGVTTKMTLGTVTFDTNNNWSAANNRYTPTIAGKYIITARVGCENDTAICIAEIFKNGSTYLTGSFVRSSQSVAGSTVSAIIDMNGTSDYLEEYGYQEGGTTIDGQFSGALLASLVASGGGIPAGTTGQMQFNTAGAFNADSKLSWDNTNKLLTVGTGAATPIGTTGTVASVGMNVIPQPVSYTVGTTSGGITINPAATGQMAYYSGASAISGTSNLFVSGSSIGIGTTVPLSSLHVVDPGGRFFFDSTNSTSTGNAFIQRFARSGNLVPIANDILGGIGVRPYIGSGYAASSTATILINAAETQSATAQGNYMAFGTTPIGTNIPGERMRIDSSGNVGIGTAFPQNPLHVRTGLNDNMVVADHVTMSSGIAFAAINDAVNANVPMEFRASTFDFTAGNVGIGSATPVATLDVNGTIRSATGGIQFPDGTTQTTAASGAGTLSCTTVTGTSGVGTIATCATGFTVTGGGGTCTSGFAMQSTISGNGWLLKCENPNTLAGLLGTPVAICCKVQ